MIELRELADRVEIDGLRAEFADAVMMHEYDRLVALFTPDGVVRIPGAAEAYGREQIRAGIERLQGMLDCFVQTTHPGAITIEGDSASGRTYLSELIHTRAGDSHRNYGIYHDRYRRTPEGWRFAERVYEARYVDTTPLTGSAPAA